jgi:hypothetical protein
VRIVEGRPMPPLGHFSLIRFARTSGFSGKLAAGRGELSLQTARQLAAEHRTPRMRPLGKPAEFP